MPRLKVLLAFALGWSSVAAVRLATDPAPYDAATASRARPGSVDWRIAALEQQVSVMEKAAAAGKLRRETMAPFEVVSRAGQRLFYVTPDREVEFHSGGKIAAEMSATGEVGTLWAMSSSGSAALTGTELTMKEADHLRVAPSISFAPYFMTVPLLLDSRYATSKPPRTTETLACGCVSRTNMLQ